MRNELSFGGWEVREGGGLSVNDLVCIFISILLGLGLDVCVVIGFVGIVQ